MEELEVFPDDLVIQTGSSKFMVSAEAFILYPPYPEPMLPTIPSGKMPLVISAMVLPASEDTTNNVGFSLVIPKEVRDVLGMPLFYMTTPTLMDLNPGGIEMRSVWFLKTFDIDSSMYMSLEKAFSQDTVIKVAHGDGVEYLRVTLTFSWKLGTDLEKENDVKPGQ